MELTTRNASLSDLFELLTQQHARKLDLVVPAGKLRSVGANLVVTGSEPIISDEGVTSADGTYRPTAICDEGIADKLGVPVGYLKRLREERPDIFDANVNGWLHGGEWELTEVGTDELSVASAAADGRKFLVRTFKPDEGERVGVARALLSDRFGITDHIDCVTAALDGVKQAGVDVEIVGGDITDRKMYLRVAAPQIAVLAPVLLKGYRSPFGNGIERGPWDTPEGRAHGYYAPEERPIIFAGFEISNSETGGGATSITPRLTVGLCRNGWKITVDAFREIHVGGRLDEGIVRWSEDTQRKSLELITAKARDAVATFLSEDYLQMQVDRIEAKAVRPIVGDVNEVVTTVCKTLKFSEERTKSVLDHFVRGGQLTAGGVLNAVTSVAQTLPDADAAAEMEAVGMRALDVAARAAA